MYRHHATLEQALHTLFKMTHTIRHSVACCAGFVLYALAPLAEAQITVTELQSPYSFVTSQSGKEYFISSVNGEPEIADNNGFITKLDANGKLLNLKFIQGGKADVTLHAPKGMALVDQTLYVADLDQLRAFDIYSGKSVATITVAGTATQPPAHLTDVAYDGKGLLYCSDQKANRIYRVELATQKVSILITDPHLAGP